MHPDDLLNRIGGAALIAWHHRHPTVTAPAYLASYRRVLFRGLSGTRRIYLDTNYWIRLRKAEAGQGSAEDIRLLQTLRSMVRGREALCVSQLHSLLELGKQQEASLRVTAGLLDELTEQVAIASPDDVVAWECAQFVNATLGIDVASDLCIWTKVGQIHKNELPTQIPGPVTDIGREVVLKATVDSMWNATFEDVFSAFNWDTKERLNGDIGPAVLAQVEEWKRSQKRKAQSRESVRVNEFAVALAEQLKPVFIRLVREWQVEHNLPDGMGAIAVQIQSLLDVALSEFKVRESKSQLPCIAIPTELYTLYETTYERTRPLLTNDWLDWRHAAIALPYCDMFFTERHLAHQLRQELRMDVRYGCDVIGTVEEALSRLL